MNELFCLNIEEGCEPSRFMPLPASLNGHRFFYKGDSPEAKESIQEQEAARLAQARWRQYEETYKPLEDQYMDDVDSLDTDAARNLATGAAASAVTAKFSDARGQASGDLMSGGINPNSGKFQSVMAGLSDAEGASSSSSKAMASNSMDDDYVTGLQNISAIGKGQATNTQAGLSELASSANNKAANDAGNAWNNQAGNINAAGSLAGAATYFAKNQKTT